MPEVIAEYIYGGTDNNFGNISWKNYKFLKEKRRKIKTPNLCGKNSSGITAFEEVFAAIPGEASGKILEKFLEKLF